MLHSQHLFLGFFLIYLNANVYVSMCIWQGNVGFIMRRIENKKASRKTLQSTESKATVKICKNELHAPWKENAV